MVNKCPNLSLPPPAASVEQRRVAISTAPPPSDAIGENADDLLLLSLSLSLSPSYHDDFPSPEAAARSHGRESTIDREPTVVPWSINPIHNFSYKKQFREIPENAKIIGKPLIFLINL
jgi:hypothetical protein